MERKRWKSESEKVNGERGEFDEYDVCSEWQKGQMWLYIKRRWVADWFLNIVADWFLNIQVAYISSRFLLYIKGSTCARTLLYGFLILIIRIHFAFTFTLSTDSPNSPFTTFTFSLSLFHFCQMWLLTFWPFALFESSPMLSPAVPSEP